MKTIRRSVFETNSSSTHSISMCSKKDYEDWRAGKMYFDMDHNEMVSRAEAMSKLEDLNFPTSKGIDSILMNNYRLYTYENYNHDGLERFSHNHTTPGGEQVVAFGKWGHD